MITSENNSSRSITLRRRGAVQSRFAPAVRCAKQTIGVAGPQQGHTHRPIGDEHAAITHFLARPEVPELQHRRLQSRHDAKAVVGRLARAAAEKADPGPDDVKAIVLTEIDPGGSDKTGWRARKSSPHPCEGLSLSPVHRMVRVGRPGEMAHHQVQAQVRMPDEPGRGFRGLLGGQPQTVHAGVEMQHAAPRATGRRRPPGVDLIKGRDRRGQVGGDHAVRGALGQSIEDDDLRLAVRQGGAKGFPLGQSCNEEPPRPFLPETAGDRADSETVAVGLDHGRDLGPAGVRDELMVVVRQSVEIDGQQRR